MAFVRGFLDLVAFFKAILCSVTASAMVFFSSWRASENHDASPVRYHDLKAFDTITTPLSAQEDSMPSHGDDLERGLTSPLVICFTPVLSSPPQYEVDTAFSPPPSATPSATATPILTSSILSPYILQGSGISLSESAQALLSGRIWGTPTTTPELGRDHRFSVANPDTRLQSTNRISTNTKASDEASSNPRVHLSSQASDLLDCSDDSLASSISSSPTTLCDCNHEEHCPEVVSSEAAMNPVETQGPETLFQDVQPPTVTKRRRPSVLRHSLKFVPISHIPGTPAPPLPFHTLPVDERSLLRNEETSNNLVVELPMGELAKKDTADKVTTFAITSSHSTASFRSLPNSADGWPAAYDDEYDLRLPSSISAPEPHYYEFYYEHYCQEPMQLTFLEIPTFGDLASEEIAVEDDNVSTMANASMTIMPAPPVTSRWVGSSISDDTGNALSSSFSVPTTLPTTTDAASVGVMTDGEPESDRGDLSMSDSAVSSTSDGDTETSLSQGVTLVHARRASVSKPTLLLKVPGTRESVVVAHTAIMTTAATGEFTTGRNRSGTTDTRSSASTSSTGIGGVLASAGDSMSDIHTSVDGSNTSLEMADEGDKNIASDEEEVEWLPLPPGIGNYLETPTATPAAPLAIAPAAPGTLTLFNDNHRRTYVSASLPSPQPTPPPPSKTTPLVGQPTFQLNFLQLVVSRVHDFLPTKLPEYHHRSPTTTGNGASSRIQSSSSIILQTDVPQPPPLTFSESRYPHFGDLLKGSSLITGMRSDGNGGTSEGSGDQRREGRRQRRRAATTQLHQQQQEAGITSKKRITVATAATASGVPMTRTPAGVVTESGPSATSPRSFV